MGEQIGTWADAGVVRTADAADDRGLATLIRRLAPRYDGRPPAAPHCWLYSRVRGGAAQDQEDG